MLAAKLFLRLAERGETAYIVTPDCPGFGGTKGSKSLARNYGPQFVQEVTAALGFKSAAALVGTSIGGSLALHCAVDNPAFCKLLCCHIPMYTSPKHTLSLLSGTKVLVVWPKEEPKGGLHPFVAGQQIAKAIPNVMWEPFEQVLLTLFSQYQ